MVLRFLCYRCPVKVTLGRKLVGAAKPAAANHQSARFKRLAAAALQCQIALHLTVCCWHRH